MRLTQVLPALIGVAVGWLLGRLTPATGAAPSVQVGPTIEHVRELSELVTIRVDVADVQETLVAGHLGSLRVALILKGDFLLSIDLTQARFESVDAAGKTAVLVLPTPRATSPRVDHDRTRVVAVTDEGLWTVVPGDDAARGRIVNLAYIEAQRTVAAAAADRVLVERARRRAEQVLSTFFRAAGWAVRVQWKGWTE